MTPDEANAAAKRDELAALIWGVEADEIGTFKTGVTSKAADDIADAILAAGWRPPTPPAHAIECSRPTPSGVMVDRLQAAVSAALALAQEWADERANFEELHDYSNYRLSVLNNAAQKLRDAIGSALRGQE